MEDLEVEFDKLKISAFEKLHRLDLSSINNVTIGPNANQSMIEISKSPQTEILKSPQKSTKRETVINQETPDASKQIADMLEILEFKRLSSLKSSIQGRIKTLEEFSMKQEENKVQQWLKIQQCIVENMHQREVQIVEALNEFEKKRSQDQAKLEQYYQSIEIRRQKQEQELKMKEMQTQVLHGYLDKIKRHQEEFNQCYQELLSTITKCPNNDELKSYIGDDSKLFKTLPESFDELLASCKTGKINEEDVNKAVHLLTQLKSLILKIRSKADEISSREVKQQEVVKSVVESEIPQSLPVVNVPDTSQNTKIDNVKEPLKPKKVIPDLNKYVSSTNLKMCTQIVEFHDTHTRSFQNLEQDVGLKQFKFDCKKAINIPVNSLSGVNSEHILDKYNRLHNLLKGSDVFVGDKRINASQHPEGIAFCMDLLAKKFVLQGDLIVSSNPESAFCYATVIISLWNDFPTFGKLLLAHFYKNCPYLVPHFIPQQEQETDEQFYMRQGYQYNEGEIEKQDKYLKRMTGIMRLYAAILIVKPKLSQSGSPHDIKHGWRWISSFLKIEPQVDITATMLHAFLETAGFEMAARYGRTFQKIITIIANNFLPSLREKCTGGAVTRLELLLKEYFENKMFTTPNGYLECNCW